MITSFRNLVARNKKTTGALTALAASMAIAVPFVQGWEGRENTGYLDPVQIVTACDGITGKDMSGKPIVVGKYYSDAECDALLERELARAFAAVDRLVVVPMPAERRAAMASFVYNAGEGNFAKSTMLRKLNTGDAVGACNELRKWVYAKGVKLKGLVRRREAERALCLKGTGVTA